jgi:hypothetical protein
MGERTRFPIRFTGANRAMVLLGITRGNSFVDVTPTTIEVRMGVAFAATMPRGSITSVSDDHDPVTGWGAHGWRGVWLVNGSSSGIVRIEFGSPGTARVLGFPVQLRVLRVAVEDPAGLQQMLQT